MFHLTKQLEALQPNKFALLQAITPKISDDMLWRIAQADYGFKADFCMEALRKIRKTQTLPKKIEFALQEVNELIRWTEAESKKEHWMRLFACTNLLMMAHDTGTMGENQTLANLLESIILLDEKLYEPTLQLIAYRLIADEENRDFYVEEQSFFIYALLYLMILLKKPTSQIKILFDWLVKVEVKEKGFFEWNPAFLLGTSVYDQRHRTWKKLTKQLIPNLDYLENPDLKEKMKAVLDLIITYKKSKTKKLN